MGRHKKVPTGDGGNSIVNSEHVETRNVNEKVLDRLGLRDNVCMSCNARNDASRNKCRKCGAKNLRQKRSDFHDS